MHTLQKTLLFSLSFFFIFSAYAADTWTGTMTSSWAVGIPELISVDQVQENFKISYIEMIAYDKLEITFNAELEDWENVVREFKITNIADEFDELEIVDIKLNPEDSTKLQLTLAKELVPNDAYQLIVIALHDIDGRNIESGYDSAETFIVPESILEPELNSAMIPPVINTLEWVNVPEIDVEVNTLSSAAELDKLPQTGPELLLIFILTLILWACLFVFKYKKSL